MKKCPFCAEEIQDEAIVCKHCGRDLKGGASQVQIVQPKKKTGCVAAGCATVLVLAGIGWLMSIVGGSRAVPPPDTRHEVRGPGEFQKADELKSLETSEFCKRYGCPPPKTWQLRDGGVNHSYTPNVRPAVSLEVSTAGGTIRTYGIEFYERRTLAPKDLEMVWSLIRTVQPGGDTASVRQFVRSHIETDVHQILQAKSIVVGPYRLWAGKVIQQIVHIQREPLGRRRPASR